MRRLVFAANWKMNIGPGEASAYIAAFLQEYQTLPGRLVWFFPPYLSVPAVAQAVAQSQRPDLAVGVQDIFWEDKGAFTGAISAPMAGQAGAPFTLIGHSERRHVFGETDEQVGKKVGAAFRTSVFPVVCVGETLAQRDAGKTLEVVQRQLEGAFGSKIDHEVVIAYEPVWAIGTGRNATPKDAADVHRTIRAWLSNRLSLQSRATSESTFILYGGSVNLKNIAELLAEPEINGVLVGGASLDPKAWAQLVRTGAT